MFKTIYQGFQFQGDFALYFRIHFFEDIFFIDSDNIPNSLWGKKICDARAPRTCQPLPGFEPPAGLANVRFIFIFFRQKYKIFNPNPSTAQQFNQSTQPATIVCKFSFIVNNNYFVYWTFND